MTTTQNNTDFLANCPVAATLAARLRVARDELTARWLERILDRVALTPNRVFPTEELLDHVPLLVLGIADYMEDPARAITADAPVVSRAMELGALRYAQGFDAYEILKEYEIFGGILFAFLARTVDEIDEPCSRTELLICGQRLFQAVALIQQTTTTQYLRLMKERLAEREARLRAFNRALTHELRNRIGAAMGAAQLLELPGLRAERRKQLGKVIVRNVESMRTALDNLVELSRTEVDTRAQRHVYLRQAAEEACRQLREMARAHSVELRLSDELPEVEVNAAAVELCLSNLLSNAIKYAHPAKATRWAEVRGRLVLDEQGSPTEVIIEVLDNGVGVPEEQRPHLFEHFFRGGDVTESRTEGTGLGLSIVRETIQGLGGRVWAEFPKEGSLFAITLPCRRAQDGEANGVSGER